LSKKKLRRATKRKHRDLQSEEGFEVALQGKPSSRQYETKLDGKAEVHLIALVCSEPPAGYWAAISSLRTNSADYH
jgi:hypothetical protein